MGALVLGGRTWEVAGVRVSPAVQLRDVTPRTLPINAIVLHVSNTSRGLASIGTPSTAAEALGRYFEGSARDVSADYAVDRDSIAPLNDPLRWFTWHASQVNPRTIGIEMALEGGRLDVQTIANTVRLVDALTGALSCLGHPIQRQVPARGGRPFLGVLDRARSTQGAGRHLVGVYGHCSAAQAGERGPSDPGPDVFTALMDGGYEGVDYNAGQDLVRWRGRREWLGLPAGDGVPGRNVASRLAARGRSAGLWVHRPGGIGEAIPTPALVVSGAAALAAVLFAN